MQKFQEQLSNHNESPLKKMEISIFLNQFNIFPLFYSKLVLQLHSLHLFYFISFRRAAFLLIPMPFLQTQENMPKYIISLPDNEPYPFDGVKQNCSSVIVRKSFRFSSKEEEKTLTTHLHLILELKSKGIIQIVRVLERKSKEFVVDYEYVGENLKNSQKVQENGWMQHAKEVLKASTEEIAQVGIKIELKIDDVGVTAEGELKMFLPLTFEIVSEGMRKMLVQEYHSQIQHLFQQQFNFRYSMKAPSEISDYSYRLDKKITQIEDKLNRRKRRRSKGGRSSTQKADSSSEQPKKQNIAPDCLSSKHSNGSMTSQKTWYSQIDSQPLVKPRIHKSSFNDFTTTSHKLNQPGLRDDSLKKRLTTALEKTQQAFKIYDKHFKRPRKF